MSPIVVFTLAMSITFFIVFTIAILYFIHVCKTREYHESLLEELIQEKSNLQDRITIIDEMIENEQHILKQELYEKTQK